MIKAVIPSYHSVEEDHGKSYTVFLVEFYHLGRLHRIEKRYRTFHSLHKQLKKVVATPEFPPKRVRNWNSRVLEHRRKGLEQYLQRVLELNPVPKHVLSFLGIQLLPNSNNNYSGVPELSDASGYTITHQPIVSCVTDTFVSPSSSEILMDMVVRGVLKGLYDSSCPQVNGAISEPDSLEE